MLQLVVLAIVPCPEYDLAVAWIERHRAQSADLKVVILEAVDGRLEAVHEHRLLLLLLECVVEELSSHCEAVKGHQYVSQQSTDSPQPRLVSVAAFVVHPDRIAKDIEAFEEFA